MTQNDNNFYEDVLIKLRRQYGKDEVVAALEKKLSEANVKNGQLLSEIDHLNELLQSQSELKEINRKARIEAKKDELYQIQSDKIKALETKNKSLMRLRDDLISKMHSKK